MDLESVVDELYGLEPGRFTAARDARAKEARDSGDRELAASIKALRRPSTAAWAVNLLARQRSEELERLLDLGQQLRQAQDSLAGDEIRALGHQRHQVVAGMASEAARLARQAGTTVSEAARREVEDSLEAALADPDAGAAVSSGRLVRAVAHAGLDAVDLTGAVAGPAVEGPAARAATRARAKAGAGAAQAEAAEAARAADAKKAAEAEAEAEAAAAAVEQARAERDRAEQLRREAAERARDAEAEVERLREELDGATRRATESRAAAREAEDGAERAGAELDRAERAAAEAAERARDLRRVAEGDGKG